MHRMRHIARTRTGASIRASAGSPLRAATGYGWRLAAPVPVGDVATFLARLRAMARGGAVALGVDLPIGLPRAYAARLPERDFLHFLATTAHAAGFLPGLRDACRSWAGPAVLSGARRARHDAGGTCRGARARRRRALSRACDRATAERPAGAPLFWTLGANQSGKAAIAAWQAYAAAGAGRAAAISASGRSPAPSGRCLLPGAVALAETYPAEALRHLGIG